MLSIKYHLKYMKYQQKLHYITGYTSKSIETFNLN